MSRNPYCSPRRNPLLIQVHCGEYPPNHADRFFADPTLTFPKQSYYASLIALIWATCCKRQYTKMRDHPDELRKQVNEQKLIRRAQKGDSEAFGVLYTLYLDPIYRYVYYRVDRAATAEDLTGEVFVRAWEALPSFKVQASPFKSWLYQIAHNLVIDHHRKQSPITIDDEILQRMPAPSAPLEQGVLDGQNIEALVEAVQQ